jgi:hypothetical protein
MTKAMVNCKLFEKLAILFYDDTSLAHKGIQLFLTSLKILNVRVQHNMSIMKTSILILSVNSHKQWSAIIR